MSILYPFQDQAVDAAWSALFGSDQAVNRVAIELPTGTGKTVTFSAFADRYLDSFDGAGNRVLVLVHTDELVRQAVKTVLAATRGRWTVGVVKAGQDETGADIVVASVQTLANPLRRERIVDVGLVIVDECHHAVATTYMAILEHYGAMGRHVDDVTCAYCPHGTGYLATPTLGVTATLARSDGTPLGSVWQDLVFSRSLSWAIRKGYLTDLTSWTVTVPDIDASATDDALDAMMATGIAPEKVVDAWEDKACGLSTVLFAPAVASAQRFADAFNAVGVKAEVVHGAMPEADRLAVLDRLASGVTTVVANCMVLTEGWDCPRVSCVIVARPTKSVPLFVQMVGRGLRVWLDAAAPPREEQMCVLLSLSDNVTSLATVANLSDKPLDVQDGKPLSVMEDEWDIGKDIEQELAKEYVGPLRMTQWDAFVQQSSKAWKYTTGGAPFLPTAKSGQGYVFVVQLTGQCAVFAYGQVSNGRRGAVKVATAPDMQLAMSIAEDEAQDRGGDIGALLADKTRPWRKGVPSDEAKDMAKRVGVPDGEVQAILSSKASGKAGKLSDAVDKVVASRVIDRIVVKIKQKEMA